MRIGEPRFQLWLLICVTLWAACGKESATQVIIEIDAEEEVRELAHSFHLNVEGGDDLDQLDGRTTRRDEKDLSVTFPKIVLLRPKGGDVTRAFALTATVYGDDGEVVSQARIITGYVPHQTQRARLLIEGSACLGVVCESETQTCSKGNCVAAKVVPSALDGGVITFPDGEDGGLDADVDSGDSGDEDAGDGGTDSGPAPVPVDAGDAGDAGPDAARADGGFPGIGEPCEQNAKLSCAANNVVSSLICSAGIWKESASRCNASQRCDSRPGPNAGLCADVLADCIDHEPGDQVCRDSQRLTCGADRVTVEMVNCPTGQVCVLKDGVTSCLADDSNECELRTDDCDDQPDACSNEARGFSCKCPNGYSGNGKGANGCVDVDECAGGATGACGMGATGCTNLPGSYECACPAGYTGDKSKACVDIPECALGATVTCGVAGATCSESSGSFSCTCPAGYMAGPAKKCVDIRECDAGVVSACGVAGASCTESTGSFSCMCPAGYTVGPAKKCIDVADCSPGAVAVCGAGATGCTETPGSFTCTCTTAGFTGTGTRACAPTLAARPQCMSWVGGSRGNAVPTGAIERGYELTYNTYPGTPFRNRHFLCQIASGGANYPAKLVENSQIPGRTWGCYTHDGMSAIDAPTYRVLNLMGGCSISWVNAGSSLPANAVVMGDASGALLVPCSAPVSSAPFPLSSMDPYSVHTADTHLGWVSSAGPYSCRYQYVESGFVAPAGDGTGFQIAVWN